MLVRGSWDDGTLVTEGAVYEHAFHNRGLSELIGAKTRCARSEDVVYASELAFFTSGRRHRTVNGFSVYWRSHSDVIYSLTGITQCVRIYIECGRSINDVDCEIYNTPKVYLVRTVLPMSGSENVSWPGTALWWSSGTKITLDVHRVAARAGPGEEDAAAAAAAAAGQKKPLLARRGVMPVIPYAVTAKSIDDYFGAEEAAFAESVGLTYARLTCDTLSATERSLVNRCFAMANKKNLFLLQDTTLGNFFLCQVCLYILDEDSVAEEIIGVLRPRGEAEAGTEGVFDRHRTVLKNALSLAKAFNYMYDNRDTLPKANARLNESDLVVTAVRRYFAEYTDVPGSVVSAAKVLLEKFYVSWSAWESLSYFNVVAWETVQNWRATRYDLVRLLRI